MVLNKNEGPLPFTDEDAAAWCAVVQDKTGTRGASTGGGQDRRGMEDPETWTATSSGAGGMECEIDGAGSRHDIAMQSDEKAPEEMTFVLALQPQPWPRRIR